MKNTKTLIVQVDEATFTALHEHKVQTGVPLSETVRRAIKAALKPKAESGK
jgi:hypothetical protein